MGKRTFEERRHFPDAEAADAEVLAEGALQEEHGNAGEDDRQQVRHQKRSCRVRTQQKKQRKKNKQLKSLLRTTRSLANRFENDPIRSKRNPNEKKTNKTKQSRASKPPFSIK